MTTLKISCAQLDARIGDFEFNLKQLQQAMSNAQQMGAHVLLTPELSLCGYLPEDLLKRPSFQKLTQAYFDQLRTFTEQFPDLNVMVGLPTWVLASQRVKTYNSVVHLKNGRELHRIHKQKLPNEAVFDELRFFSPPDHTNNNNVIDIEGVRVGIIICEDVWHPEPAQLAKANGAQLLLVPNASPFHANKQFRREGVLKDRLEDVGLPMIYVNRVGVLDELVFDGASFAMNPKCLPEQPGHQVVMQMPMWNTCQLELLFDVHQNKLSKEMVVPTPSVHEQTYQALVLGVKEYVHQTGFSKVLLGLSGGIDSALTMAVAVDALGAENVHAVMMPTTYTAQISLSTAKDMADRVGVRYDIVAIQEMFELFKRDLSPIFEGKPEDVTEENLQARIRGVILMAISNKHHALVLNTGNKSELATGYCTLYGDMIGAYAVLKDVYKTDVYDICEWRNRTDLFALSNVIPQEIIDRPPSAELRDNQVDQDSLPPYEILDAILEAHIEQRKGVEQIVSEGIASLEVATRILKLVRINEYKRRQGALGTRVTPLAFGKDWRVPIMNRFEV